MNDHVVVDRLKAGLGPKLKQCKAQNPRRIYIDIDAADLVDVAKHIFSDCRARFAIATGLQTSEGFEILYHFAFDADQVVVSVRVSIEGDDPEVDSITPLIPGAGFIEREIHDLLGIKFRNHPNLERLILSDDWPEGVYPLRRGKPWEGKMRKEV